MQCFKHETQFLEKIQAADLKKTHWHTPCFIYERRQHKAVHSAIMEKEDTYGQEITFESQDRL